MKLVGFHPHAVGVGAEFAGVDAEHHILRIGVFLVHVMGVARANQRQAHFLGNSHGPFHLPALNFDAIVLDFDEIPIVEYIVKPGGNFFGFAQMFFIRRLPLQQRPAEFAGNAAA
jgi:hypothetical protein